MKAFCPQKKSFKIFAWPYCYEPGNTVCFPFFSFLNGKNYCYDLMVGLSSQSTTTYGVDVCVQMINKLTFYLVCCQIYETTIWEDPHHMEILGFWVQSSYLCCPLGKGWIWYFYILKGDNVKVWWSRRYNVAKVMFLPNPIISFPWKLSKATFPSLFYSHMWLCGWL